MAIEVILDSLDNVGESLKGFYVEDGDKFKLDVDKYTESVRSGVDKKNKELLGKLKNATDGAKRFAPLAELDDDELEELVEYLTTKKNGGSGDGKKLDGDATKAEVERATAKLLKKHETEKGALTTENETLKKRVQYFELTVPLREIALKAGVFPEDVDLALFDTQKYFRLGENGKIVVLDEDGDVSDMKPEKFFTDIYRERRPRLFSATGAGGSGADKSKGPTGTKKKTMKRADWQKLTPAESTKFFKEGGTIDG